MSHKRNLLYHHDSKCAAKTERENFCLVGIDEAGRGPWAGPVVAAAVVLPSDFLHPHLNDSKKLTPQLRFQLCRKIKKSAQWAVGVSSVSVIDTFNILQATHFAMKNALNNLMRKNPALTPHLVLIDGLPVPYMGFPQKSIVRGDSKSAAIAAASIIAKVTRDQMMVQMDQKYPQYGFHQHKGYGTRFHQETLLKFGPSPIHRKSFSPMRDLLSLK